MNFCWQIVTEYKDNQLPMVLNALERMNANLTAAVVSNDQLFLQVRLLTCFREYLLMYHNNYYEFVASK